MDQKFQTSFIPKAPIAQVKSAKSGMSLFLLISIIIFLVSLGLVAWVYLEKNYLIGQITTAQNTITTNKTGLISDSNTVENIIDLDNRINVAKELLANHVAISPIFAFLEQATIQDVRFNSFTFSSAGKDANGNSTVSVQLAGVARDWESVASQEDEFDLPDWQNIISNAKLSNFSLNADGSVSFTFSATINPKFISYASANASSTQSTQ
jgi:hypothetical protein